MQHEWNDDECGATLNAVEQPELEYIDKVRLDTPINHTSISPDGRSMIAVGDTKQVFVFDINAHGQHTLIDTIEGKLSFFEKYKAGR